MDTAQPLEVLFDAAPGVEVPFPPELRQLYGPLHMPQHVGRPYIITNFVSSMDGVISLGLPGHKGGAEISGGSREDRMIMGLLRALSDAVIVGMGTLRSVPRHVWTAERIYRPLGPAYQALRARLGKPSPPWNVFVTASGDVDLGLPVFGTTQVPVLVVATPRAAARLAEQVIPPTVQIVVPAGLPPDAARIEARQILAVTREVMWGRGDDPNGVVLLEAGPHLTHGFWAARLVDELFLTLAPQVAGRDAAVPRLSLVEGHLFAPDDPLWGDLVSARRCGSHLFLRYAFGQPSATG